MKPKHATLQAILLILAATSFLAPFATAQSNEVESDLAFALGLAERFKYVDLAEGVLEAVDARGVSGEERAALDLTRCKVFGGVARREGDPVKRKDLYSKSLSAYRVFLDRHPFAENITDARREYVDLVNAFGRVLEAELEDLVGEEAATAKADLTTELEAGLELTGELISGIGGDATEIERQAKFRLMISRGQMLLTLAKVSEEPTFLFGQAEQTLEKLALDSGETSVPGLQAYLLLGEVKVAQGQYEDAQAFMEYVATIAVPREAEALDALGWSEMPAGVKQQRFKMLELGMSALVRAYMAGGDSPGGTDWGLHMLNIRNRDGLTLTPRGDLAMLALSRALLSSGGIIGGNQNQGTLKWYESDEAATAAGHRPRNKRSSTDLALNLAQDVNDRNKGNTLQIRAQAVISEITDRPGVVVSPEVLFEAAQGKYFSKQYGDAVLAFKEIRGLLDGQDAATQKEYGARTLHFMANAYNRLGRKLEAALTFKEAIKNWDGDPEFDSKNASGYLSMMKDLRSSSSEAKVFVEAVKDAENEVIEHQAEDSDPGLILVSQGDRSYGRGEYKDAQAKYEQVDENSKYYEKGLTKAGLCFYKLKDKTGAKRVFGEYINVRLKDSTLTPTDTTRQSVRKQAEAMAVFYLGRIAASESNADEAIALLDNYHLRFPSQDSYGPLALYTLLQAHLAKKQFTEAEAVLDQMVEAFPTNKLTARSSYKVYEIVKAAAGKEPTPEQMVHMATLLGRFNELSAPSFANSRTESKLLMSAQAWAKAEVVLRSMQATFSEGPEAANVESFILPDLGLALLNQKKVPEAFAVLNPVIPDPDDKSAKKPSGKTVATWCRSVTGWLEGDAKNIIEVPGFGKLENLEKASAYWNKLLKQTENTKTKGGGKWTPAWYEAKLNSAYNYYQWSKLDTGKAESGKNVIEDLINVGFGGDREMKQIAEACGDDVLRRRFLWLLRKF